MHYSAVMKREWLKKANLTDFKTGFVLNITYSHKSFAMTKRVRLHVQASEIRFLPRFKEVTLFNIVRSSEI